MRCRFLATLLALAPLVLPGLHAQSPDTPVVHVAAGAIDSAFLSIEWTRTAITGSKNEIARLAMRPR